MTIYQVLNHMFMLGLYSGNVPGTRYKKYFLVLIIYIYFKENDK